MSERVLPLNGQTQLMSTRRLLEARTILDFDDEETSPVKMVGDSLAPQDTQRKPNQGYADFLNVTTKLKLGKLMSLQNQVQQEQVVYLW